jgi:3-hydroxymyristoyl/3-hydroxydecanoyl-(acyl carrier protein) dehydratase
MTNTYCDQSFIKKIIPHRDPFLFVDRVVDFHSGKTIIAEKFLSADDYFFQGHFPGTPIMPGVLVTEALAQTSGLLLGLTNQEKQASGASRLQNLYLATVDIKFLSPAHPGETLVLASTLKKKFGNLRLFAVTAGVKDRSVAKGTLALGGGA